MSRFQPVTRILAGAFLLGPLVAFGAVAPAGAEKSDTVTFRLNPAKGSEAKGTATLTVQPDGDLSVHIKISGLTPNMPHAQHIHGDVSGKNYFCPNDSRDVDDSGFLSVEEGLPDYGGIHVSLTTKGDTSPKSGLAVDRMPVADSSGNVEYHRTITADSLPEGTTNGIDTLHIVQHGVDANDNDKYDLKALGESTFARSLGVADIPAEATDVANCGEVVPSGGVATGGGSTPETNQAGFAGVGLVAVVAAGIAWIARRRIV